MPRQPRVVAVDYPHHVTQRGNNREQVFLDRSDYLKYLELLQVFSMKHKVQVCSYCLMPNHVHLLLVPGDKDGFSRCVGTTNLTYTQYLNKKYKRTGRIWQSRFFSCVVGKDEYLWSVYRYIEQNPVKAGMVDETDKYEWSSAKARACGKKDSLMSLPAWLDSEPEYKKASILSPSIGDQIRSVTRTGRFFGSDEERVSLESTLNIKLTSRPRGRPKRK